MSGGPSGAAGGVAEPEIEAEPEAAAEPKSARLPATASEPESHQVPATVSEPKRAPKAAAEPEIVRVSATSSPPDPSEPAMADAPELAPPIDVLLARDARRSAARGEPAAVPGVVIGTITGADGEGRPLVRWPSGPNSGVPAVPVWMRDAPPWSECAGLRAVIGFEGGDESRPLLLGLLDPPPAAAADRAAAGQPLRTQRIEGGEELVLQCGDAKIVLRADGSITILGAKVVSRARGVNKIKGGSVQIN